MPSSPLGENRGRERALPRAQRGALPRYQMEIEALSLSLSLCDARSPIENRDSRLENRESWPADALADLYRCERIIALLICKSASVRGVRERARDRARSQRAEAGERTRERDRPEPWRTLVIYLAAVP